MSNNEATLVSILIQTARRNRLKETIDLFTPQQVGDLIRIFKDLKPKHKEILQKNLAKAKLIENDAAKKIKLELIESESNEVEEILKTILSSLEEKKEKNKQEKALRTQSYRAQQVA